MPPFLGAFFLPGDPPRHTTLRAALFPACRYAGQDRRGYRLLPADLAHFRGTAFIGTSRRKATAFRGSGVAWVHSGLKSVLGYQVTRVVLRIKVAVSQLDGILRRLSRFRRNCRQQPLTPRPQPHRPAASHPRSEHRGTSRRIGANPTISPAPACTISVSIRSLHEIARRSEERRVGKECRSRW